MAKRRKRKFPRKKKRDSVSSTISSPTNSVRKSVTALLTEASIDYLTHKMYGVYKEVGFEHFGKFRFDIIGINLRGEIVGHEIKSCYADFLSDKKYMNYLRYVDKMYFVFPHTITNDQLKKIREKLKKDNIGIMILDKNSGYLKCKSYAKSLEYINRVTRMRVLSKLCFRGAEYSRINRSRRTRRYITESLSD